MNHTTSAILGIDPGNSGGLAILVLGPNGEAQALVAKPMPCRPGAKGEEVDAREVANFIGEVYETHGASVVAACVEIVHAMPKQGVSSCFTFGKGYGKVLAVIEVEELPLYLVTPQEWKRSVLAGLGREKQDAIRFVKNVWPKFSLKKSPKATTDHDGIAEAVCIAEYGRRKHLGQLETPTKVKKPGKTKPETTAKPKSKVRPKVFPRDGDGGYDWFLEYEGKDRTNTLRLDCEGRSALSEAANFLGVPVSDIDYSDTVVRELDDKLLHPPQPTTKPKKPIFDIDAISAPDDELEFFG